MNETSECSIFYLKALENEGYNHDYKSGNHVY